MAITRPNVSVQVVDNSFVIAGQENGSTHISGMYSPNGLLTIFGVTADRNIGYMTVENLNEWVSLLNGSTYGNTAGPGPTGAWKTEWYSAYNYLLYGGVLKIASNNYAFYDAAVALDSVFTAELTTSQVSFVTSTVAARDDLIGVVGCTFQGYTGGGSVPSSPTLAPTSVSSISENRIFAVGGEKSTLGWSNVNTPYDTFITVPLAADAAGCLARTDRDYQVWYSPAGLKRGRILNVVSLVKALTPTDQDSLYTSRVNPVIGIAGTGTYLFGDITREGTDTSTLTRINVVRCLNYIKKALKQTANSILFEFNDATTRSLFTNAANGFLNTIKEGRGLYDYKVVCDETNNPGSVIDANQFVADIYVKPTKSVNYVKLTITNLNTDAPLN
jgi:hypothetical protein